MTLSLVPSLTVHLITTAIVATITNQHNFCTAFFTPSLRCNPQRQFSKPSSVTSSPFHDRSNGNDDSHSHRLSSYLSKTRRHHWDSATTYASSEADQDFRVSTQLPQSLSPLSPRTFAGQVEQAIIEKFGQEPASRVLDSWRLMDKEYEHRQYILHNEESASKSTSKLTLSLVDPSTSFSYQHAHSYVPGLTCKPFWDVNEFKWCQKLAKDYSEIRKEFLSVTSDMQKLQKDGNNVWAGALTEEAGGYGEGWRTLVLMNRGMWDSVNCNLFPKTSRAIKDSGIPAVEAFFASMKPHTNIKMHSDFTNFVLTSHLALDIPENGNNKCRLTIGDVTRQWINGNIMLFDTSIMHDAVNEADGTRYILMFRLWHPDLSEVERNALQFIYDCLEAPELLSEDAGERFMAEQKISMMRSFPNLEANAAAGFGSGKKSGKGKKNRKAKSTRGKGFGD